MAVALVSARWKMRTLTFFDSPDLKASATVSVGPPAVGEARPKDERAKQKLNSEDVDMLFAGDGDEASDLESNSDFDCGDEDVPDAPPPMSRQMRP